GGGIRTLVTGVTGETVFETAAFNHSATPPHGVKRRRGDFDAVEAGIVSRRETGAIEKRALTARE
ncbi:hypothetical protein VJ918_06835, partial [Adlercreutzia sp. R21]|uniref:hypothetical protein n=1 Tax=Adlercreutzia wanghongyangiae TaxID=3111451 RepID=UPI002DB6F87F